MEKSNKKSCNFTKPFAMEFERQEIMASPVRYSGAHLVICRVTLRANMSRRLAPTIASAGGWLLLGSNRFRIILIRLA